MKEKIKSPTDLTSQYVKDYYDKFLKKYEEDYAHFRWFDSEYSRFEYSQTKRAILKVLGDKRFTRVLEIGSGDGVWTEVLIKKSQRVTALDISVEMTERIKKRLGHLPNLEFIRADFLKNSLLSN